MLTTVTETVSINKANNYFRYVSHFLLKDSFSVLPQTKINNYFVPFCVRKIRFEYVLFLIDIENSEYKNNISRKI